MAGEDKHSKKHPASDKKKRDLKKKGTVPKSQDVPMAFGLIAAFGALLTMKKFMLERFLSNFERYYSTLADIGTPDGIDIKYLAMNMVVDIGVLSAPVLFAVVTMALVSNVAQAGLILTGEQLKPDIKKINPMNKLKQWFSIKSLQELAKSLAKIIVASFLGWLVFKSSAGAIAEAVGVDQVTGCSGSECSFALMSLGAGILKKLFIYIIILYVTVAIVDYGFQKKNFSTEHKMTDKEVKDEYKNSEGDPYQKGKRRQMAQQIAMQSSQENVPGSDVVVVNPTELAIALKYDPDVSPVPWVVAKGEVGDADAIRESARNNGIPVVRNKPLARALFELSEIGDIVPEELYRPVAEILAYVFQLKEQTLAEANDAAAASPAATHASDAAQAAHRLDADAEGVHDLGQVAVPVVTQVPAVATTATAGQSALNAGAMWGPALTAPASAPTASDSDRYSWNG